MKRVLGFVRWLDLGLLILLLVPLLLAGMGRVLGLSEQARVPEPLANPRVAIVHAAEAPSDAAIETMVRQALDLALGAGGLGQIVSTGDTVLLKVNLGTGLDVHEITSWQVARAVALVCQEVGAARVIIAEGPELGIDHYAQAGYTGHLVGVEYLDFNAPSISLVPVHIVQPMWEAGQDLILPRPYLDADVVISVPKMKTHSTAGVTVSLKNAIGVPPVAAYRSEPDRNWRDLFHSEYGIHKTIVQINQARKPDLVVIDAILSGEGDGPWGATPVQTNMVLASCDPVAADAVAAASMGFDPERVRHLVYASFEGLGQVDLAHIDVVGASLESVRRSFAAPSNVARLFRRTTVLGAPPPSLALDGILSEWEASSGLWVRRSAEVREGAASWSGIADASLQAWVAYDQDAFYLAARVWDSRLLSNYRAPSSVWNGDALELYISGAGQDLAGRGASYAADDFRLGIGYGQASLVDINRGQPVSGAIIATQSTADGYALEMRVPWSLLNALAPTLNREIGLDLALDDADDTANRESLLVWSGTALVAQDVREMGIALLAGSQGPQATSTPASSLSATASLTKTPTRPPTLTLSPESSPITFTATPTLTRSLVPVATSTTSLSTSTPRPSEPRLWLPLVLRGPFPGQAP